MSGASARWGRGVWPGAAAVLLALAVAAPAAAADGTPPSARQFEQRTAAFLAEATIASATPAPRSSGGTAAPDPSYPTYPPEPPPAGVDPLVVALYGAPQLRATVVGKRSPGSLARKLSRQAGAYEARTERPVVPSVNLIGVIALASPGSDRLYRSRQAPEVIARYLELARSVGARLTLDVQPGRSPLIKEVRALRGWLAEPDVDLGIDPEWIVGKRGVPGRTKGKLRWRELNRASQWLQRLVRENALPPKLLVTHQFHDGSIRKRAKVRQRRDVAVTLNFDGIGSPQAKLAGYRRLATAHLDGGFSLFYDRDSPLMRPPAVLRLDPPVSYVMYQ